jgi:hypothetical protein
VADDLLGGGVGGEEDGNAPAGAPELAAGVEAFAAASHGEQLEDAKAALMGSGSTAIH